MSKWLTKEVSMPKKFIEMNLRYFDDETTIYEEKIRGVKVVCNNKIFIGYAKYSEPHQLTGIGRKANNNGLWHNRHFCYLGLFSMASGHELCYN